jgi:hypothetical protein
MANKNLLVAGVAYADALTTELNSLAAATFSSLGPAIDNTTNLNLYVEFSILLASLNPTAQAPVEMHIAKLGGDGTHYDDLNDGTWVGNFIISSGSSAKYTSLGPIRMSPGLWKPAVRHNLSVSLASSGNHVYYRTFSEQNNG